MASCVSYVALAEDGQCYVQCCFIVLVLAPIEVGRQAYRTCKQAMGELGVTRRKHISAIVDSSFGSTVSGLHAAMADTPSTRSSSCSS